MDRRIETRVVEGTAADLTTIIQKNACEVWWITVTPKTAGTMTAVRIYDGFDTGGKQQWHAHSSYCRQHNFIPPIPCDYGLTVCCDAETECYTIAYRPKGWPKE